MAVVRKKQDDKNLKILREIVTTGAGNRECFDCGQKGPTYVNMTIGSFVCTRCSGVLRGLTPPHRVKSISMATFTNDEIEFLKTHGNDCCGKTWLGLWDPKRVVHQDQRELMIDKYEKKRYYLEPASPLKSLTNNAVTSSTNNNFNHNNNNSFILNNSNGTSSNVSSNDNSFKNITLTPPRSSRLQNGGSGNHFNINNSHKQFNNNQFHLKDDNNHNGFINGHQSNHSSSNNQHYQPRPIVTNKASLNISTALENGSAAASSKNNSSANGFTPESDFVADFNSANIFNAVSQKQHTNGFQSSSTAPGQLNGNNGGNRTNEIPSPNESNTNENFADFDHAPIYNAAANDSCMSNYLTTNINNNTSQDNYYQNIQHKNTDNSSTFMPFNSNLFNSNVEQEMQPVQQQHQQFQQQQPIYMNSEIHSHQNQNVPKINQTCDNINCGISYPSFGSNTNTAVAAMNPNNNHNSNNIYMNNSGYNQHWNVWQQFPWPQQTPTTQFINNEEHEKLNQQPEQQQQQSNRWSLPISSKSKISNSLSSSATFNSSSSLNSTPPADRYAALKDLDEQFREIKVAPQPPMTTYSQTSDQFTNGSPNVNPFKTSSPMPIQQNQQQIANPFQTNNNNNGNNNGNGVITNGNMSFNTNGGLFGSPSALQAQQQPNISYQEQQQQQQQQQQNNFLQQQNFNNNFGSNSNFGMFNFSNGNGVNGSANNNMNNGYQSQIQQQQLHTSANNTATMISTGENGCGMMGFGVVHQNAAGSNIMLNIKNPFVTSSSLNSNNPFL